MKSLKEIKDRLAFLNKEISNYPYWGAALSAMDEERQALINILKFREKEEEE